jgi:hypothetical protein
MRTSRTVVRIAIVIAMATAVLIAQTAKEPLWQEGTVIQIAEETNVLLPGRAAAEYNKGVTYTIQTDDHTYIATETAGFVTSKFAAHRATENDTVKFVLRGSGLLFMLGRDGKEHRMLLRSSAKRQP